MLRLDAAGAILRTGLLARLFCIKVVLFRAVAQRLYINQKNTRQGALAVLEFADVDGVALILIYGQTADILHIVGNLSAGVVLIAVLIADKLDKRGLLDADLFDDALLLLPDDAITLEEVRLFAAQIKLVAVDCFAEEESNISFIEL